MKLQELYAQIGKQLKVCPSKAEDTVCIKVSGTGFGGTSVVSVESVHCGFDWDNGKFIIYPKHNLSRDEDE